MGKFFAINGSISSLVFRIYMEIKTSKLKNSTIRWETIKIVKRLKKTLQITSKHSEKSCHQRCTVKALCTTQRIERLHLSVKKTGKTTWGQDTKQLKVVYITGGDALISHAGKVMFKILQARVQYANREVPVV